MSASTMTNEQLDAFYSRYMQPIRDSDMVGIVDEQRIDAASRSYTIKSDRYETRVCACVHNDGDSIHVSFYGEDSDERLDDDVLVNGMWTICGERLLHQASELLRGLAKASA